MAANPTRDRVLRQQPHRGARVPDQRLAGYRPTLLATTQIVAGPAVVSVAPSTGVLSGRTSVTISGLGFTGATAVDFLGADVVGLGIGVREAVDCTVAVDCGLLVIDTPGRVELDAVPPPPNEAAPFAWFINVDA